MPIPPETNIHGSAARHVVALWTAMLSGPLVWLASLIALFFLVDLECRLVQRDELVAIVAGGALLIAAAVTLPSWLGSRAHDEREHRFLRRERFMRRGGVVLGAFSIALLVATAIPLFFLRLCD